MVEPTSCDVAPTEGTPASVTESDNYTGVVSRIGSSPSELASDDGDDATTYKP